MRDWIARVIIAISVSRFSLSHCTSAASPPPFSPLILRGLQAEAIVSVRPFSVSFGASVLINNKKHPLDFIHTVASV